MSELSLRHHWLTEAAPSQEPGLDAAIADALGKLYDQGRWSQLLPLRPVSEEKWQADAVGGDGKPVRFQYTRTMGLVRVRDS